MEKNTKKVKKTNKIKKSDELTEDERMIAFRIGANDFHFVRKNSDGTWTHKPGCDYILEMSEDELFDVAWGRHRSCPYVSDIAFFAVMI